MMITRGFGGNGAVLVVTRGYGKIGTPQSSDWLCLKNIHHNSHHMLRLRGY